jgi:hypothetical protein
MDTSRFRFIKPGDLPDYRDRAGDISEAAWPEFMLHDPIANENWHELFDRFSEYQFALLDTETDRMAAMGNSLPFCWDEDVSSLPEGGWDWVLSKQWKTTRMASGQTFSLPSRLRSIQITEARD